MKEREALKLALEALENYKYAEARTIIRKALAKPERKLLTEWQPIETAPKDGRRVLLARHRWTFEGSWCEPHEGRAGWYPISTVEEWQMREEGPVAVSHWMPLPEPPATQRTPASRQRPETSDRL